MSGRKNNKKILVDNSDMIKKSNELSLVKMNQGLTLVQMQLLAYAIYTTQQENTSTFIKADFERKFDMEKYTTIRAKSDVKKILSVQFSYEDLENDEFVFWNAFQSIRYNGGTFSFKWTEDMLPNILDLKNKYILTDLTIASRFNSNSSWILYDYLRAKYGCWYVTLSKEELMSLFDVENVSSYKRNTSSFKDRVLNVAIEEINKYTEIEVYYDEIKDGRSIIGFKINWSTGGQVKKASKKQMDILNSIVEVIFKDVPMYMEIKSDDGRQKALLIIRELQQVQSSYLYQNVGLTADKCAELTKKANDGLETLNELLENKNEKVKVPLHNWLES